MDRSTEQTHMAESPKMSIKAWLRRCWNRAERRQHQRSVAAMGRAVEGSAVLCSTSCSGASAWHRCLFGWCSASAQPSHGSSERQHVGPAALPGPAGAPDRQVGAAGVAHRPPRLSGRPNPAPWRSPRAGCRRDGAVEALGAAMEALQAPHASGLLPPLTAALAAAEGGGSASLHTASGTWPGSHWYSSQQAATARWGGWDHGGLKRSLCLPSCSPPPGLRRQLTLPLSPIEPLQVPAPTAAGMPSAASCWPEHSSTRQRQQQRRRQ